MEYVILVPEFFSVVEMSPIRASRGTVRISAPRRLRQKDPKFAASLAYIVNSSPAWAI